MEKIKVLHLITHLGIGGAQDNTLITVRDHSRQRYEVHLATGQDYTDWIERGRDCADAFYVLPDLHRAGSLAVDLRALGQLTRFVKEQGYQVVHTHSAKAGTLGRIAARRAGVPVIVHTFHSFGWQVARTVNPSRLQRIRSWLSEQVYLGLERYAAAAADALITVSELNRRDAIRARVAPEEKLTTIYSGVDLGYLKVDVDRVAKARSLGLDPTRPIVGTVGRLSEQKAPLDFVAAAKLVLQQRPDAQCIMVGDGPLAEQVRAAIGDERAIRVLGYRADVPEILATLDVFALSSLWEGLGRALTEAMVVGVPVAATAVDGVPELVAHRETGLLSAAADPAGLANNILWLLDHPLEAQAMSARAKARVEPVFGAERMVEQIEALYERLLGGTEQVSSKRLSEVPRT